MAVDAGKAREEALSRWQVDATAVRERMCRAPTPRERERWHALWRALQGWPRAQVAAALGRDPHTVAGWRAGLRRDGPAALACAHTGGAPPPCPRRSRRRSRRPCRTRRGKRASTWPPGPGRWGGAS